NALVRHWNIDRMPNPLSKSLAKVRDPHRRATPRRPLTLPSAGLCCQRDRFRLGQPQRRRGVGWHAPVAARRQRAARADLGPVGYAIALELVGEETPHEDQQPAPDLRQWVAALEGVQTEARQAPRPAAETQQVIEEEIVQLVGADDVLGALDDLARGIRTQQLGA